MTDDRQNQLIALPLVHVCGVIMSRGIHGADDVMLQKGAAWWSGHTNLIFFVSQTNESWKQTRVVDMKI